MVISFLFAAPAALWPPITAPALSPLINILLSLAPVWPILPVILPVASPPMVISFLFAAPAALWPPITAPALSPLINILLSLAPVWPILPVILPVASPPMVISFLFAAPAALWPPITAPALSPLINILLLLASVLPIPPVILVLALTLPAIFNSLLFAVPWALVAPVICVTCDILTFSPIVILLKFAVPSAL
ncbi:hypothetical protein XK09_06000 [Campylobacter lanienae]|uniref:Uncharacterized protein n=2 Tax=Campylobacter lanienae TaxID=75658 RepID=A0ABY3G8D2_9BACT|nr:hypothetical protein XK09_06000 [Campylobacter lanienae]